MKHYEYRELKNEKFNEKRFNDLGKMGYEVCCSFPSGDGISWLMKREIDSDIYERLSKLEQESEQAESYSQEQMER